MTEEERKTFTRALREAFTAGYESHIYDPSDRSVNDRFLKWRLELTQPIVVPTPVEDDKESK